VVVEGGTGTLHGLTSFGATVSLSRVRLGTPVVVRTNFHPAWSATSDGSAIALSERGGQLSFDAPCNGDCAVTLHYPKRRWLLPIAALVLLMAGFGLRRLR
jgi:hypothetical protein